MPNKTMSGERMGTPGQPRKNRVGPGGINQTGGGAMGQPKGSQNKPCKPHFGAQGQRLAGSVVRGAKHGASTTNAYRKSNDKIR